MFNPRDLAKKTRVFPLRAGLITLGLTFAVPVAGPPSSWAAGPTNVSGYILADTTWSLAGSPYIVTGNVFVYGNTTNPAILTIEAGVEVRFNQNCILVIGSGSNKGALKVLGTESSPVLFTSNQVTKTRGYWGRLEFSSAADPANTVLNHFTVEYGGYGGEGNISVRGSAPTFNNATIRESSNYGMYLRYNAASPLLQSVTFRNNAGVGVYVYEGSLRLHDVTFTATESTYTISMPASTTVTATGTQVLDKPVELRAATISQSVTWRNLGAPYVASGTINVYKDTSTASTLTIEPGVEIRFNQNQRLWVGMFGNKGALVATGTATAPILLTSNQASKTPGYWYGVRFEPTALSSSVLEYVTVEYAGYSSQGNIYINGSSPTIRNSTIRHSSNYGVYVTGAGAAPLLRDNNFVNNATYGLYNNTNATLDGRASWWNHPSGPSGDPAVNAPGTGDKISVNILYTPWLGASQNPYYFVSEAEVTKTVFNKTNETTLLAATLSAPGSWTLEVLDQYSAVVKTYSGTGSSVNREWGGEQDGGAGEVPDGDYTLRLTATDSLTGQAMAPLLARVNVVSTNAPVAIISSPPEGAVLRGGDVVSVQGSATDPNDFVSYRVEYGAGAAPTNWYVITNPADVTTPVSNGQLASWNTALAGTTYTLRLTVRDATSAPTSAHVRVSLVTILSHWASPQYFSPNADGANDATTVSATLTLSANWTLTFKNGSGVTVRTFAGNGISVSQTWDGKNDSGLVVPVGAYTYTLEASEPASGVSAAPKSGTVRVDLSQPVAVISAPSQDATVFDTVNITGTASDDSGTIQHYDVEYGAGSSPPSWSRITRRISQVLNATLADWITNSFRDEIPVPSGNGLYTIRLTVQDWAGNVATDQVRVNLDNLYISNVSRTNPVIRPVQGETASINFTLNQPVSSATLRIVAEPSPLKQYPDQTPEADAIRTINLGSLTAGAQTAGWNGNDDASRIVPDEAYVYVIEARTASGRFDKFNQHVLPPVTTPSPAEVVFPANATAYDPYKNQFVSHSFQMFAGPARTSFKVEYTDSLNRTVTLWPQYSILLSQGLNTVFWDGRDGSGNIVNDVASMNYYISDFVAGCDPCGFAEHLNFTGIKGNYILVTGGTPVVPGVSLKSDPYLVYLSYGQIARLRYTLESDANVTVTVKEPASGALTTLLSDVAQTAGEHEVLWDGRNGSGQLSSTQGHYTFTVTATNPATGASRTRRANITVRK